MLDEKCSNRERVAVEAMKGILANPYLQEQFALECEDCETIYPYNLSAELAIKCANALIQEL